MNNHSVAFSIAGKLGSMSNEQSGRWEFVYEPPGEAIRLEVSMGEKRSSCELSKSDIKRIINWLQSYQDLGADVQ